MQLSEVQPVTCMLVAAAGAAVMEDNAHLHQLYVYWDRRLVSFSSHHMRLPFDVDLTIV